MGPPRDHREPVGCYLYLLLVIAVILIVSYVCGNWLIRGMY